LGKGLRGGVIVDRDLDLEVRRQQTNGLVEILARPAAVVGANNRKCLVSVFHVDCLRASSGLARRTDAEHPASPVEDRRLKPLLHRPVPEAPRAAARSVRATPAYAPPPMRPPPALGDRLFCPAPRALAQRPTRFGKHRPAHHLETWSTSRALLDLALLP